VDVPVKFATKVRKNSLQPYCIKMLTSATARENSRDG